MSFLSIFHWVSSLLLLVMLLFAVPLGAQPAAPDRLQEALDRFGLTKDDLGYRPKGYWSRHPVLSTVPHKLPFFDDLYAEPLRMYDFTKIMVRSVSHYFTPAYMSKNEDALFKLAYFLGIEKKVGGFRGYSGNLHPVVDGNEPMLNAFEQIWLATGSTLDTWGFGGEADWPRNRETLKTQLKPIPISLQRPMAALILNVLDAYRWQRLAVRNVNPDQARSLYRGIPLATTILDGQVYYPEFDDIADALDEQSLYYAAQKAVQACETAKRSLTPLLLSSHSTSGLADTQVRPYSMAGLEDLQELHFEFPTSIGRIVLSGSGGDEHLIEGCALVVDLGGNDLYRGAVGATTSQNVPVSVALDLGGDDTYLSDSRIAPAQGAGILGVGVLADFGGNDTYEAVDYAQGFGLFGLGLLYDQTGDDEYRMHYSGQGAGYFGIGLHLDRDGSDQFYLWGDGQGFGGVGGVGVLLNGTGNDTYIAEADAAVAGRGDYHSGGRIAVSNAQGVGSGRRADGSDGHAWAGGMGALFDMEGNDVYESGNWSIGTGYWFGTGILYDRTGDDRYRSVYFTQGSGAHFCNGAVIDDAGNDIHILYDTGGAGLAFGWDFTNALFIDKGGNDVYDARIISIGNAMIRSTALFVDIGGSDRYTLGEAQGMGSSDYRDVYSGFSTSYGPYAHYGINFGLMLDIGGEDLYFEKDLDRDEKRPDPLRRNGSVLLNPDPGDKTYGYDNYGLMMDVASGTVPDFYLFDEPLPMPMLAQAEGSARPVPFKLSVYPNPFNSRTVVDFFVEEEQPISLKVYNVRGQIVKDLLNGCLPAGGHSVVFDAKELASGIYVICLEGRGIAETWKATLAK